jgi:hypothetical protein
MRPSGARPMTIGIDVRFMQAPPGGRSPTLKKTRA